MGNNAAYTEFEETVIILYDSGVLNKDILSNIMERYRGTDIDTGGMRGTLSKDGLDCEEITLKVFGHEIPKYPNVPKSMDEWTEEEGALVENYWEMRGDAFDEISIGMFGWG